MSKSKKKTVIICIILTVMLLGSAVASAVPTKKPTDDTPTVDVPIIKPDTGDDNTETPDNSDGEDETEEIPVIFSNNVATGSLTSIYRYRQTVADGSNSGAAKADSLTPVLVGSSDLPAESKDGNVIDNTGIKSAICLQEVKTQRAIYANMLYNHENIKELALNEDGTYKYKIQITYLINAPKSASIGTGWTTQGTPGAVEANNADDYGKWVTKTYDVEYFTSTFMAYQYYWNNGEYIYSVKGYAEDPAIYDEMVFLNYGLTSSNTVDFYLADICFVPITAAE